MGLLDTIADVAARDDELGETVYSVLEGLFECGHAIADAIDEFGDKLGEIETELSGDDGEESCWAADRNDPAFDSSENLQAVKVAVDSIVSFGDKAAEVINGLTEKVMDLTDEMLSKE